MLEGGNAENYFHVGVVSSQRWVILVLPSYTILERVKLHRYCRNIPSDRGFLYGMSEVQVPAYRHCLVLRRVNPVSLTVEDLHG